MMKIDTSKPFNSPFYPISDEMRAKLEEVLLKSPPIVKLIETEPLAFDTSKLFEIEPLAPEQLLKIQELMSNEVESLIMTTPPIYHHVIDVTDDMPDFYSDASITYTQYKSIAVGQTLFDVDGRPVGIMLQSGRVSRLSADEDYGHDEMAVAHVAQRRRLTLCGDL